MQQLTCQMVWPFLSGTGDSQPDSRESIRANHSQLNSYFYSASGRFARITRISDSRESPNSRESCESIRANHATKGRLFFFFSFTKGLILRKVLGENNV